MNDNSVKTYINIERSTDCCVCSCSAGFGLHICEEITNIIH